jgi:DNA-binding IclR family transcriptional regulator
MVPVGWYSVRVALVRGMKEVIHTGPIGEVRSLTDGMASRAILSTFPDERIGDLVEDEELRRELAWIRQHGYSRGELPMSPGFSAVALPLRGQEGAGLGAIAIEGPVLAAASEAPLPEDWLRTVREIEARVRADPQRFRNHYSHVDPRAVRLSRHGLHLPETPRPR